MSVGADQSKSPWGQSELRSLLTFSHPASNRSPKSPVPPRRSKTARSTSSRRHRAGAQAIAVARQKIGIGLDERALDRVVQGAFLRVERQCKPASLYGMDR